MSFSELVRRYSHLGLMMLSTSTDDDLNVTFSIEILINGEWCFVAYGTVESTVLFDADRILQSWLV